MLYYHLLIVGSDYKKGMRVALHYSDHQPINGRAVMDDLEVIRHTCGDDIQLSTHKLLTNSNSWKSIVEKDIFFKEVNVVSTKEDFAKRLLGSRELSATDIATYILSMVDCTNLKLQKLLYLCYADYIVKYKKPLFKEKIYAYQFGPLVKVVYDKYKRYGKKTIVIDQRMDFSKYNIPPTLARVLFSKNGMDIALSCIETLKKYASKSPTELVNITHRKGGPWDKVYKRDKRNEINEDVIKLYHKLI